MVNKKLFAGILVMALVFGFTAVGCSDDPKESDQNTWKDVTSIDQLNGTWKGSYSESENEEGITMTLLLDMTYTFNSGTMTGTNKSTMTFSGTNINDYWDDIKAEFSGKEGVTINNADHSITETETLPSQTMTMANIKGVQINGNGTKLKVPAGLMGEGSPEVIFTKQ